MNSFSFMSTVDSTESNGLFNSGKRNLTWMLKKKTKKNTFQQ